MESLWTRQTLPRRYAWACLLLLALVASSATAFPTGRGGFSSSVLTSAPRAAKGVHWMRNATRGGGRSPVRPAVGGQEILTGCDQSPCTEQPWQCGVMSKPIGVYLIWYGRFTETQKDVVRNFVDSINAAEGTVKNWWAINTLYKDCSGQPTSTSVTLKGETDVHSAIKFLYGEGSIARVATRAIEGGALPADEQGIYFVIGGKHVRQGALLGGRYCAWLFSGYCGWHSDAYVGNTHIKTSFVGVPRSLCMGGCADVHLTDAGIAPNGDMGMDALVSTFAHELAEAATDPYGYTNTDASGNENADICSLEVGKVSYTSDGAPYNLVGVNGVKFLIQQNYNPVTKTCVSGLS